MARWLCIHLPYFRTERITRASPTPRVDPFAIVREVNQTAFIVAATPATLSRGIALGMTLSEARAIVPSLAVAALHPESERRDLESLAACAIRLSPRVFISEPQTLLVDVTGCERTHGGEGPMLALAHDLFARLGYRTCVSLCDNATAGYALSLCGGKPEGIADGATSEAIRGLPLESLRLDKRSLLNLQTLGLQTAGELLALPPETLPSRFDESLVTRVRQLRGELNEEFEAFRLPEIIRERLEFEGPTDRRDTIMFALRHISTTLAERLEATGTGACRLEASLLAADGAPLNFALDVSSPTRDSRSLATLLLARFETLDTKDRWFDAIEARVPKKKSLSTRQQDLFAPASEVFSPGLRGLVDELVGRLGVDAVVRAKLESDPRPEKSFSFSPLLEPGGHRALAPLAAPAVLWAEHAVSVDEDESGLPVAWHEGERSLSLRVVRGPQRVEYGWWEGGGARDYFEVEDDEGARLFLFRQAGQWFMRGAF